MILPGRDHGLPTYLQGRKLCGYKHDFKTFDDLREVFPASMVELLRNTYEDVRDIDLYVGGTLETMRSFNTVFFGEVIACLIVKQLQSITIAADPYYFLNPTNPYPFTTAQLDVIHRIDFQHLICVNTGLTSIARQWHLLPNAVSNPLMPCTNYPQIDLSAWKDI